MDAPPRCFLVFFLEERRLFFLEEERRYRLRLLDLAILLEDMLKNEDRSRPPV